MKTLFALSIAALLLAGCNTMEGFGKDVQKVGSKVEGAARR
jgi:entericidin A